MTLIRDRATDHSPHEPEPYFSVRNAPGPFHLISQEVKWYEQHGNRFIVELTIIPIFDGSKTLLGHNRQLKIPFEVVLKGATTALGHGIDEPRNVRLLGRFLLGGFRTEDVPVEAADELDAYQWEVLFNTENRKGLVFKLRQPLPISWTL